VYFVGVDLAWGERNPTGVAVVDPEGRLVRIGTARDDAAVVAALWPYVQGDCLVAIDAPLVVTNQTGRRPAEIALNRDFHPFQAGAHPANTGKPEFAAGPRGARLANALGLDMDPQSSAARRAIEVYPHPATVALFRLGRTLKYKVKPGRGLGQLRSELLRLMDGVEGLAAAAVPLRVAGNDDWIGLRRQVVTAERKSDLRRAEDPVDAVVCAYVALYADRCPADVITYGDFTTGYIVTPALPSDLAPAPREPGSLRSVRRRAQGGGIDGAGVAGVEPVVDQLGDEEQHDAGRGQDADQQVLLTGSAGQRRQQIQRRQAPHDRQRSWGCEVPTGFAGVTAQHQYGHVDDREHGQQQKRCGAPEHLDSASAGDRGDIDDHPDRDRRGEQDRHPRGPTSRTHPAQKGR